MKIWTLFSELDLGPAGVIRIPVSIYGDEKEAELGHAARTSQLKMLADCELAFRSPGGLVSQGAPAIAILAMCGVGKAGFRLITAETTSPIVQPQGNGRIITP